MLKLARKGFYFFSQMVFIQYAFAQLGKNGSITSDLETMKTSVSQWGTTASGIALAIAAGCAVTSLILPWRFFKETLGRASWIGLSCALIVFVMMSFFGNSIHQHVQTMLTCPLGIIGFTCQ